MPRLPSRTPWIFLAVAAGLGACAPAARPLPLAPVPAVLEPEPEPEPDLIGAGPVIDEVEVVVVAPTLLGHTEYDLPVVANTWVEAELRFLVDDRSHVIERWMERGDHYEAFIKQVLAEHGLPTDLYHLAMIESGFVPTARSRAGAVGLWQFMPATARLEGLRVDREVDERLDPVRSTYAAARHLQRLYRSFGGDWPLAAAAYNAGSGRISRGLQGFGVDNFWDLATVGNLAAETRHYVPRLYAMTIVARDRGRFGFSPAVPELPGFFVDSVMVDIATPLTELAALGEVPIGELTRLNPHLLQQETPQGDYHVWVPAGHGPGLQLAFQNSDYRKSGGVGVYVVRRGDSLSRIAQLSGVPSARIRSLNPRVNWERLQIGHRVRLPASGARAIAARVGSPATASTTAGSAARTPAASANGATTGSRNGSSNGTASGTHLVRTGDTLWSISRQYGISVAQLQSANELKGSTIRPGRSLVIPGGNGSTAASAAPATESGTVEHVVKPGESLWSIARGYSSSVAEIQRLNRMNGSVIRPGDTLLVPR